MALIDISVPIRPSMPIYDRNPGVRLERALSIPDGETANVSRLELGVHTGTHLDAPLHFFEGGADADSLMLEPLIGKVFVADGTGLTGPIDATALAACDIPPDANRVILKTPNSALWARDAFTRNFIRLDGSGARFLVERRVQLIGIDYLSIGDADAHRTLLGAGVAALEGLDLRHVDPGWYELICLPLRLPGSDGAPARAVLRTL
jgi:arylformamidase